MASNFKYTILAVLRNPSILFWPLAFPIIMSLLFNFMFANIEDSYELAPVSLAVVTDDAYKNALGLDQTLHSVDADDEQHIVDLTEYKTEAEARDAVLAGEVQAYLTVEADMEPRLHVPTSQTGESERLHLTAVLAVLDGYVRVWHEMQTVAMEDPAYLLGPKAMARLEAMLADGFDPNEADFSELSHIVRDESDAPATMDLFLTDAVSTRALKLTAADPDPSARYYYALLGMAAGLGAAIAFTIVRDLTAKGSALGARRVVSGTPRSRLLVSGLVASWLLAFGCLVAGLLFMRYAIHVDFGDRTLACLGGLGVSSFAFCALGALLGSFPSLQPTVLTAITMPLAFFAGLYGTASQRVADGIAVNLPWLAVLNPVRTTAQLFYSLLYYDTLDTFWSLCLVLVAMGLVLASLATARMRRQSYATL